ncbi:unnamed protein product [Nesidiocoris tenuis]|uniref:Geranylgeranyl transferase type-2 subunit alpha n=1 Tax=Nesidiocoris tenuis TaxID=355587 RepID=A0A6H5HGJ1_9HEMI|nr:unnamed protein product [Nesidiocoris tenuis]
MHGQKKTDKSEAVKEKERKQKEAKLKEYRDGMAQIATRREAKLLDWDTMGVISDVLRVNPDVYTLWNLRKEIILLLLSDDSNNEEPVKLGENELRLTESCLKINPKSYGAWHHRKWILENCPGLDLKIELALCTKYLKLDSRNFHCWDYRRFVVSMLDLSPEEELSYTLVKIEEDFSNYSSWHYRSKLLPLIHGDPTGQKPIEEEIHLQELDLVQNAAFTDPNDSSAWYYLRWLVGELQPKLDVILAFVSREDKKLFVGFNRNASLDRVRIECSAASRWRTVESFEDGSLWFADLNDVSMDELVVNVSLQSHEKSISLTEKEGFFWQASPQFDPTISEKMKAVLEEQLDSCNQLLDLEPDTKWPLLTSVVFMKAIDSYAYRDDIMKRLESLKKMRLLSDQLLQRFNEQVGRFLRFKNSIQLSALICHI